MKRAAVEERNNHASGFLGVAVFLSVFLVPAFFAGVAFLGADFAVVFVTRPDLVLPRTLGTSTTAGAWTEISLILLPGHQG
jgi:hypothetical protein